MLLLPQTCPPEPYRCDCGRPSYDASNISGPSYRRGELVRGKPCIVCLPDPGDIGCPRCGGVDAHLPTCGV